MANETWVAKTLDVNPEQWRQVGAEAALSGVTIRQWVWAVIEAAIERKRKRRGR